MDKKKRFLVGGVAVVLAGVGIYKWVSSQQKNRDNQHDPWTTVDVPDLTGKVTIVTGANSGLGLETVDARVADLAAGQVAAQVERIPVDVVRQALVERTVSGSVTGSETFDVGRNTSSPLADHCVEKTSFPFEGKLNELYAKAMAIEDARGRRAVLLTLAVALAVSAVGGVDLIAPIVSMFFRLCVPNNPLK